MGWMNEVALDQARKFFQRRVSGKAKVTNHFMIRLYQRFDGNERQLVIKEVYDLIKFGMYTMLFEPGEEHTKVTISNNRTLCIAQKNNRLILKTIW